MRKQVPAAVPTALILIGAVAGCASHPAVPVADLTRAHTLVTQAQTSDAPRYDSVDLASAQDRLQQADSNAQSRPVLAGQMAQEASADAELAMARTRARKEQESLGQVNDSLAALREQTNHPAEADGTVNEGAAPPAPQGGQQP